MLVRITREIEFNGIRFLEGEIPDLIQEVALRFVADGFASLSLVPEAAAHTPVANLATLTALAAAGALSIYTTYVDLATSQKYWATNATTFVTAGQQLDASSINYVESGLLPPASGTIAAAVLAAGVAYVEGNRVALAATPLVLTATRDNYIDLRRDGTLIITPVVVSAAAPAIPVNSMRLGFVTTDATNVTGRTFGAFDNAGNYMFNTARLPGCKLRHTNGGGFSGFGGAAAPIEFLSADVFDNANMHNPGFNPARIVFPSPGLYSIQASAQFLSPLAHAGNSIELVCYVSADGVAPSVEDPTFPKDTRNNGTTLSLAIAGTVLARQAGSYAEIYFVPNGVSGSFVAAWLNCAKVG